MYMILARHLNPDSHIVARAEGKEVMQALHDKSVHEVVQPEFEASLEMMCQVLLHFDILPSEIQKSRILLVKSYLHPFMRAMIGYHLK